MTTPTTPSPTALQGLVRHMVSKSDKLALALLIDHLVEIPPQDGRSIFPGGIPRDVLKLLADQEREWAKLKTPRSLQATLAQVWVRDGMELTPGGTWINETLDHGWGKFVREVKQLADWTQEDVLALAPKLLTMPYQRVLEAVEAWEGDDLLEVCGKAAQQVHLDTGWLQKDVTATTLKLLRQDRSWTPKEAETYLRERLWPDWKARQYSAKHLDTPCSWDYSTDGKSLVEKIPAHVWQDVVLNGPYVPKLAEIFPGMAERMGAKISRLDLPLPSQEWMVEDIKVMLAQNEKGTKPWAQYMAGRCLAEAREQDTFSWDLVALTLAYQGKAKGTKRVNTDVLEHLQRQWEKSPQADAPGPQSSAQSQLLADGAWIMSCPKEQLEATLPEWIAKGEREPAQPAPYNEHLAHVSLARLRKEAEQDATLQCAPLAHCFWTHFLKAVKDDQMLPSKILAELLNEKAPGYGALWSLGANDTISALVTDGGLGAKRLSQDNQNMWRNILLRLQVETQPNADRDANRRMKM